MFYNKAIIIGNITRDPELKALPGGSEVCTFSVATNRVWKDAQGQKKEQVEFHNIVVFGKTAHSVAQYMKKGSQILIEGRLQTRSWDGTDGKKNYRTEIIADNVQFGSKVSNIVGTPVVAPQTTLPIEKKAVTPVHNSDDGDTDYNGPTIGNTGVPYPDDDINAEDIPFN